MTPAPDHLFSSHSRDDDPEREFANSVHRLYNARHGCGPSEVHFELRSNQLVCTMSELLTPEERERLAGHGHDRAREQRLFVRHADRELIEAIEAITGREVRAVASSIDPAADLAREIFELRPLGPTLRRVDGSR